MNDMITKSTTKLGVMALMLLLLVRSVSFAQDIDINAGFGSYDPAVFPGYGDKPEARGLFYASAGKTSGVIPAFTAMLTISLAPEVPWTGAAFPIPAGWEMDPNSTPDNLTFYNSEDWTTDDPYFEIPVQAIAPRSSTAESAGTQVFNIGGDWTDDGNFNTTTSAVRVSDVNLPVTLISFKAGKDKDNPGAAFLSWSTSAETNSDYFQVQRSGDGKAWSQIGIVASHGESSSLKSYSFSDTQPLDGQNIYRLRMVDKDLNFAYSRLQSLFFEGEALYVYPNPVDETLLLKGGPEKYSQVSILDMSGRTVYNQSPVSSPVKVNVKGLEQGKYLVKTTALDGTVLTRKVVVAH